MFRFTIRELILLTVIVAMGAAWWVDARKATSTIAERELLLWCVVIRLRDHGDEVKQDDDGIWFRATDNHDDWHFVRGWPR